MAYNVPNLDNKDRIEQSELNRDFANVPRSGFPLDMVHTTTMSEGALVPLDCFPVMPTDSVSLANDVMVSVVNPFVDRMFSGMRLYVHYYYCKCEWLWKGWKNYATKGRRGNISLQLPRLNSSSYLLDFDGNSLGFAVNQNVQSLSAYLGVPVNMYWPNKAVSSSAAVKALGIDSNTQLNRDYILLSIDGDPTVFPFSGSSTTVSISANALPFAMYQSVYRNYYLNKNLVKDNPMWFPDDDDEFILPYAADSVSCLNSQKPLYYAAAPVPNNFTKSDTADRAAPTGSGNADGPNLNYLRYRQYDGDPNTMALPFLERGGVTSMFNQAVSLIGSYSGDPIRLNDGSIAKGISPAALSMYGEQQTVYAVGSFSSQNKPDTDSAYPLYFGNRQDGSSSSIGVLIDANKLSELAVYSLWSRRNSYTDGDYNSLIRAHFGRSPHSDDRRPIYIGGSVQRLSFSEVLQTSESSATPLGTQASRAYSAGHAYIGRFEVPDFGYIMAIGSLVPDTYYTQGLPEFLDADITGSELPFPEFNSLPLQPRLNKRVMAFGSDASLNDGLFGYNEPFLDWKVRSNRLSGAFLIPPELNSKFASMTFARYFSSRPQLNNNFVTLAPWNIRRDMFSVPSQPHFIVQFGSKVSAVRPMPYVSKQAALAYVS